MTTVVKIGNLWTKIESDEQDVLEKAKDMASYTQKNWQIARRNWIAKLKRQGKLRTDDEFQRAMEWDGSIFIGKEPWGGGRWVKIPTGCTQSFLENMMLQGKDIEVNNQIHRYPALKGTGWRLQPDKEPREYQQKAVDALKKYERGIIKSPTGSGKTFMMAMLIAYYRRTTIIKVPSLTLLDQVYDEIKDTLMINEEDMGKIGGGDYEPSLITVASVHTLASWLKNDKKQWNEFMNLHRDYGWGMLIEDECQHAGADTMWDTSMAIDSHIRVGFSATPLMREDQKNIKIIGAYGEIVYEVPIDQLVEDEWMIRPHIRFISVRPVTTSRSDKWNDVYEMGIVYNRDRNRKVIGLANQMNNEGRSTLIFVDRIAHGEELMDLAYTLCDHDIEFVHGDHPERERIIEDFKNKKLPTLISTEGIIGEGFDFRDLDAIIVADGGKSSIQAVQKLGRGSRIAENKEDVKVFDFADRCKYLTDHAKRRKKVWEDHGFEVNIDDTPWLR